MGVIETGTILDRILIQTARDLAERKTRESPEQVERTALATPVRTSLRAGIAQPGTSVIAEFKRASPSKGRFPVVLEPAKITAEYIAGGAVAVSVLTDEPFFEGSVRDLSDAAAVAHDATPAVAILRKDFVIDEYQILEARAAGADAVLLIVAALEQTTLRHLLEFTTANGLDALVEVHTEDEMTRAVEVGANLIGINNRDLRTFAVDLRTSLRLSPKRPAGALVVAESGISNREDVETLEAVGVDGILVGEALVLSTDRASAIRVLRGLR